MASLYEVNLQSLYKALKRLSQAAHDIVAADNDEHTFGPTQEQWDEFDTATDEAFQLTNKYEALYSVRATD